MTEANIDRILALSVSKTPDLARLGYFESEIDRLLAKLCTEFVLEGSRVLYGGDLRRDGYTLNLFRLVSQAYRSGKTPVPFINFLPLYVIAETDMDALGRHLQSNALASETWFTTDGEEIVTLRFVDEQFVVGRHSTARSEYLSETEFAAWLAPIAQRGRGALLSMMRKASSQASFARVVVGGKTGDAGVAGDAYEGDMPGIVEEAIYTIEAGRLPVVLGAFGGAALDLAIAMGLIPAGSALSRGPQNPAFGAALARAAEAWGASPMCVHRDQLADFAGRDDTDTLARDVARFVCELPE